MQGLARLPAQLGMAAMQSINTTAARPPLMTAIFGTGALCAALAARGLGWWSEESSPLLVAGAGLYLVGVIGVTAVVNVPLDRDSRRSAPSPGRRPRSGSPTCTADPVEPRPHRVLPGHRQTFVLAAASSR
jgi:uncharacterized membrane protein